MPLAVYVLGLGIFTMVTSEFLVAGLMPVLATDLDVSIPQIGYLISLYAAAMALGGPVMTLALLKMRRKSALLVLFAIFLVGQAVGALATTYGVMVLSRLVTGTVSAAFFGVSIAVCVEMTAQEVRGRATSVVLSGLMVGTVLGLPASSLIGDHFGWRASFWAVAVLAVVIGIVTLILIPDLPKSEASSARGEMEAFKNLRLWGVFSTSTLVIGATFAAFSYFTPILTDITGFDSSVVPLLLIVYGAATVIGNNVVGRLADRHTIPVLSIGLAALTVLLVLFGLFAQNAIVTVTSLIGIGLVGVTMNPALVTRVMRTANGRPLVNTVHTSFITFGVVVGSWAGGLGISAGYGLRAPLWIGAVMAVLGFATLLPEMSRGKSAGVPRTSDRAATHAMEGN
ncbi:MFS transporter [Streptomyces sp. NPDC059479]|uniref:MFS transporter n=1 Tax=Streptomyces sp. NPDC059479 TaxID=3346848 RepID=UPI0036CAA5E2